MNDPNDPDQLLPYLMSCHPGLFNQGEPLTTRGLGWILNRTGAAGNALARLLGHGPLSWQTEAWIVGGGRLDLLGRDDAGHPRVVVEAKIHATFDANQIIHYANWQQRKLPDQIATTTLALLVPEWRLPAAERFMAAEVLPHIAPRRFRLLSFDELFAVVGPTLPDDEATGNWRQIIAMYRYCEGAHVPSFTFEETTGAWESRGGDYRRLALALTESLRHELFTPGRLPLPAILPWTLGNYRYVKLPPPNSATPAIGLFPDLGDVPFALRYSRRYTPMFTEVAQRLFHSDLTVEGDPWADHISVRLHVPVGASHFEMLVALRAQVLRVLAVAHPEPKASAA